MGRGARQYGKCLERFWQNHHAGKLPHGFHLTSKLYHGRSPAAEKPWTENASFCLPKQREINPTFQTTSGMMASPTDRLSEKSPRCP